MNGETAVSLEAEKDWLMRDFELANRAVQLSRDCQLDLLIGPLSRLFPDADTATEALVSVAVIYDHDVAEVASVLAEVLVDSQEVPVAIERFVPLADVDTILPGQGGKRFRIGRIESQELSIKLPDGWESRPATAADIQRRADLAGDIALYFSEGIQRQVGARSPVFILEASKSIEPFVLYAEQLDAEAQAAKEFEQQNYQAEALTQKSHLSVVGPSEEEIIESHARVMYYRALGNLSRTVLQLAA